MIFMTLTFNNRLNSQSYNPDFLLDAPPVKWHIFKNVVPKNSLFSLTMMLKHSKLRASKKTPHACKNQEGRAVWMLQIVENRGKDKKNVQQIIAVMGHINQHPHNLGNSEISCEIRHL